MRLPLHLKLAGQEQAYQFSFEVLPTKMVLHSDLPAMYQAIDQSYPLWRFSLVQKTEQNASTGQQRGHFPLLWFASFTSLRKRLEYGLNVITQNPHRRLQPKVTYTKAARLKGKLPYRLAEKVKEGLANGLQDKRYPVETKYLSVDTPENRFIKMVVNQSISILSSFEAKLRKNNQAPENQRLSDAFLDELQSWQQPLRKIQNQGFIKEVGAYHGLTLESLVLQQKSGYSAVYGVWQELKFYLNAFAQQSTVSMKTVAEIYEAWCFLELRSILIHELNFEEKKHRESTLKINNYSEYQMKEGLAGAFDFEREDGVKAQLIHEPFFNKKSQSIRSFVVNQKPDIQLKITFPHSTEQSFTWLFDAKYRIDQVENGIDWVPDDAINQMHRYRDELIQIRTNGFSGAEVKSRPVFGAFVLYPGFFDQSENGIDNPYEKEIEGVGIGAFALLPSCHRQNGSYWLTAFLKAKIGSIQKSNIKREVYSLESLQDNLFTQEASRIPVYGMRQVLYPDLVMTVALGGKRGRSVDYFKSFEKGTAKWYHLPQKTFSDKFSETMVQEIRFLALASTSKHNKHVKQIDKVWPVRRVQLRKRSALTLEQAGKKDSLSTDFYYLFELGKPLMLQDVVQDVPHRPHINSMKLTTLAHLAQSHYFCDVDVVYEEALVLHV